MINPHYTRLQASLCASLSAHATELTGGFLKDSPAGEVG